MHASDAGRRTDCYAHSCALAHFLALRVAREQIEADVDDVLSGKDPVAAFERLAGRSCAQLELDLKLHLDGLK